MSWVELHRQNIFSSQINFWEMDVEIIGGDATTNTVLDQYVGGVPSGNRIAVKHGRTIRLPLDILPPYVTLIGATQSGNKALIAINANIVDAAVLSIYAVDESGSGGGGGDGNYRLAGVVKVDGAPTQRDVIIVSDDAGNRQIVGEGESAGDGSFDLTYSGWDGAVIVVALDEYGIAFAASAPINAGTVVHPTTPNGYVYVVTEAGTTGATEPAWATSGSVVSGSVTFAPRPYYRPAASGPLQGELVE